VATEDSISFTSSVRSFVLHSTENNRKRQPLAFCQFLEGLVNLLSSCKCQLPLQKIPSSVPHFTIWVSARIGRMATSERQVQCITINWSVPANDNSRIISKPPISPSSSEMPPNQASFSLAQHTNDAVASIQARVRLCHKSLSEKSLWFLYISIERATRVLSSCTTCSPWICAVIECG
jgi:hypothetical protein